MAAKASVIFGTRPEAIKLAPVVLALGADPRFDCRVCVTAQHREMLDQVTEAFGIAPDVDLGLMRHDQTLGELTSRAMKSIDRYLSEEKPDLVLVQGDTTTAFCAALAAFYHHIPVGHVEAGLRTGDMLSPWPEEANRVLTSRLAALHFAPTETNRRNLLAEGVDERSVFVTGNTVIDALFIAREKVRADPSLHLRGIPGLPADLLAPSETTTGDARPVVLVTGHRRESFGPGLESMCNAIAELARRFPETEFVYPVHLNPRVRELVGRVLGGRTPGGGAKVAARLKSPSSNVHLIEPLPYLAFVAMMERATILVTDSGGIQEEGPSLGKPVLVMRDTTERPEAVEAGTVKLVGTDFDAIVDGVSELLTDRDAYESMARAHNPYGDGKAAGRIVEACAAFIAGWNRG